MPNTVVCPECGRPASVIGHLRSATGSVEYLRIRCDGLLFLLVAVPEAGWPRPAAHPAAA